MRVLRLVPIWVLLGASLGDAITYIYPVGVERQERSQMLENVEFVYPFTEEVEIMTPVPLSRYYETTSEVPETTTDSVFLRSLDDSYDEQFGTTDDSEIEESSGSTTEATTEIPTTTTPSEPTTTSTLAPSSTTISTSSTTTTAPIISTSTTTAETSEESISPWRARMLERLQKRPKYPAAKIQRKFFIAQNYGKSRFASNKTYKSLTSTTEVPSSSQSTLGTRRAFSRELYSMRRSRTTTTTEAPSTTTTTTSEATSSSTTSEPSYRKKFGRGRARFIKLRKAAHES